MSNLRSDHSFAEAITDLHQINVVKDPGEGGGRAQEGGRSKVSGAVTTQAGASPMHLMLFLHPEYDFKRLVFYDDQFIMIIKDI